jgi:hypothetical protein
MEVGDESAQWAAVKTCMGEMREPPQKEFPEVLVMER